jgi:hypothetical protein
VRCAARSTASARGPAHEPLADVVVALSDAQWVDEPASVTAVPGEPVLEVPDAHHEASCRPSVACRDELVRHRLDLRRTRRKL